MNIFKKIIYTNIVPIVGYLQRHKNHFVNVIYYHDIVAGGGYSFMKTNINVFKQQMEYIVLKGYKTLRFDDFQNERELKNEPKKVLIAFDDGWVSNYNEIFDLMKCLGLKYNIYLTISKIGKDSDYLTWEHIREMHKSGLVGFGIHTFSHPDMSDLSQVNLDLELSQADSVFESELGYKPLDFCYPYGAYSEDSNDYITKHCNYKRIYTSRQMYSYIQNSKVIFGRNAISNDENFRIFKAKLKGHFNVWRSLFG